MQRGGVRGVHATGRASVGWDGRPAPSSRCVRRLTAVSVPSGKLSSMSSWSDVETTAPEFAETVSRTFSIRKHATMATTQLDGTPRISGTEVEFSEDGEIYLGMMRGARRANDLRRDPRVAVHCPTNDPPTDDPMKWLGDGKITAVVVEVESHRFRLDIQRVVLTKVTTGGLQIATWRPTGDIEVTLRS